MVDETSRNYVPILKWKRGEQTAVATLTAQVKNGITPLIEIPPIDFDFDKKVFKKTLDAHITGVASTILSAWGRKNRFFIDLCSFSKGSELLLNGDHPMKYLMDDIRLNKILGVPVTGYSRSAAYQTEVKNAIQLDGRGVCFRVSGDDLLDLQNRINFLLTQLTVSPEEVDLIVDYEYIIPGEENKNYLALNYILNNLPHLQSWRTLTLCATSFPESLPSVANAGNIQKISRSEKKLWVMLQKGGLFRAPDFGDYAIANPKLFDMNPKFMTISANIRYTTTNEFIILKGKAIKKNGWGQVIGLAQTLINLPDYCGQHFCAGDKYIWDVAHSLIVDKKGKVKTGNSETWRTVGTNHHITFVVNELANSSWI